MPVPPIDPHDARAFLESLIAGFAVLGGTMAYFSGYAASSALAEPHRPDAVAQSINEGLGLGFDLGSRAAILALIIMVWT